MDTKVIEDALRDYKRKKSVIETTLERIEVFKDAINNPDTHRGLFLKPNRELGMPTGKGFKPEAPRSDQEYNLLTDEEQREILREWIRDDQSRIYPYQIEIEQLNGALNALTEQERFIIECKYFENMFWRDIEYSFNERFRRQNYITVEGIRKMNRQALELMTKILEPYYNRFRIKK